MLLVVGEHSADPGTPYVEVVAAALPDARIVVIDGQDHVADVLAPELFASRMLPFLTGTDG